MRGMVQGILVGRENSRSAPKHCEVVEQKKNPIYILKFQNERPIVYYIDSRNKVHSWKKLGKLYAEITGVHNSNQNA